MRVPPKVHVRIISEPASTNELASFRIMSGLSIMRSSGGRPGLRPIFCKLEPVAPSATRISSEFSRSRNLFIMCPSRWLRASVETTMLQEYVCYWWFRHLHALLRKVRVVPVYALLQALRATQLPVVYFIKFFAIG